MSGVHPIQVAIFGLGRAGQIHIKNLVLFRRAHVKYMVDLSMDILLSTQREFGLRNTELVTADESDKVFRDPEIQGVVICSTTHTHENLIRRALNAGINVFCEKPIAEELKDIIECYRIAREKKKVLHCSFNRRFDPSILDVHSRVKNEVGTVNEIKTTCRDSPLPSMEYLRSSGGFFHDCSVHDLDLICWLLNEWPTTVFAMGTVRNKQIESFGDVDVVNIMLRFPSGAIGHIDNSRHSAVGYDQRLEVAGMAGMMQVENSSRNRVASFTSSGVQHACIDHSFPERYRESYVNSMEHFLNVIEGHEEPRVDALASINVSKLAIACEQSWRSGTPVHFEAVTDY